MDEIYLKNMFDLTGKTAAVTGGGGVLCRVISLALARLGARVAVMDISLEAAQKVVAEIEAQGAQPWQCAAMCWIRLAPRRRCKPSCRPTAGWIS
jgi:NAD(P)-dependent dehydrogenase (short-subunit alcohol dehydrogenase family)